MTKIFPAVLAAGAAAMTMLSACGGSEGTIEFKGFEKGSQFEIASFPVMRNSDIGPESVMNAYSQTVDSNGRLEITPTDTCDALYYYVNMSGGGEGYFFKSPSETIVIEGGDSPVFTGSEVMTLVGPVENELKKIWQATYAAAATHADVKAVRTRMRDYADSLVTADPASPAAVYAVQYADPASLSSMIRKIKPEAYDNILRPLYQQMMSGVEAYEASLEAPKPAVGDKAPDFTLDKLTDSVPEKASLSDYRGKWVVIDFWGSWCKWCIKGIPEMKEVYEELKDNLEIVGVSCREEVFEWAQAVQKHELPWVNMHVPVTSFDQVQTRYGVTGYPTKVIVDPEGTITDIFVGEDPEFYSTLRSRAGK